jgi:hypothetical protein
MADGGRLGAFVQLLAGAIAGMSGLSVSPPFDVRHGDFCPPLRC